MAQILTGKKVTNAHHYTISFHKIVDGSAEESSSLSIEDIEQPTGEIFQYNLTNVEGLTSGDYQVRCQAHADPEDPFWTDSLVQTVSGYYTVPATTSE